MLEKIHNIVHTAGKVKDIIYKSSTLQEVLFIGL